MSLRKFILFSILAFGLSLGLGLTFIKVTPPQFKLGVKVSPAKKIPKVTLYDHNEQPIPDLFEGQWTILTFGFTNCPDICPAALDFAAKSIESGMKEAQWVFVTVDPDRDSPERLKSFTKYFHESIKGLYGPTETLDSLSKTLEAGIGKDKKTGEFVHSTRFYIINPKGQWVGYYTPESVTPDKFVLDLNRYLKKATL